MNNPILRGPGCALAAHGLEFRPELFLLEATFAEDVELAYGKAVLPETFLVFRISDSGVNAEQHEAAIRFLRRYRNEILRLSKFPHVAQVNLRCQVANGESFEERYPDELLTLAVDCGLTVLA